MATKRRSFGGICAAVVLVLAAELWPGGVVVATAGRRTVAVRPRVFHGRGGRLDTAVSDALHNAVSVLGTARVRGRWFRVSTVALYSGAVAYGLDNPDFEVDLVPNTHRPASASLPARPRARVPVAVRRAQTAPVSPARSLEGAIRAALRRSTIRGGSERVEVAEITVQVSATGVPHYNVSLIRTIGGRGHAMRFGGAIVPGPSTAVRGRDSTVTGAMQAAAAAAWRHPHLQAMEDAVMACRLRTLSATDLPNARVVFQVTLVYPFE